MFSIPRERTNAKHTRVFLHFFFSFSFFFFVYLFPFRVLHVSSQQKYPFFSCTHYIRRCCRIYHRRIIGHYACVIIGPVVQSWYTDSTTRAIREKKHTFVWDRSKRATLVLIVRFSCCFGSVFLNDFIFDIIFCTYVLLVLVFFFTSIRVYKMPQRTFFFTEIVKKLLNLYLNL